MSENTDPSDGISSFIDIRDEKDALTLAPMLIHFPDDRVFAFAGLRERWKPAPDVEPIDTCTIITTTPNTLMEPIHNRMPLILKPDDYGARLDRETDLGKAGELMRPYADGELEAVPVSKLVNSPKNDAPECVNPLV